MDPFWQSVEAAFHAALQQPESDRESWLASQTGFDPEVREEVRSLLVADRKQGEASAQPRAAPAEDDAVDDLAEDARRLPLFGAWQAVKLLGRGGMGTVYLAERADGAFHMSAAVKVVPLALASSEIEERFRRERQFLASLDHPKIARLIDGGVSEFGLPYLVMEFIAGMTIDRFCDAHRLDTRARIALVRQVLEALAYVHGRNVIHRDVKPSNILVDDSGNVKLLDFGTARLLGATAETALTKAGIFAFTPDYASPEQVRGEPCTFASDLYSAGTLLYRLLTGRLPHASAGPSPAGVAKVIAQAQPEPPRLDAQLYAILEKALAKTAAGRYRSAAEMDADLSRYLEGERVRARKPRMKFWAAAGALLALCAVVWLSAYLWRAPDRARALVPFDAGVPNAMRPALSADGKWLAFAAPGESGPRPDIWLKQMPKGAAKRVTGGAGANDEPALSPDGQWLAFHSTRQPAGIYLQAAAPAGSGGARLLVAGGRAPRFSPDGKWIAYLNVGGSGGDPSAYNMSMLYRVPAQGGTPVRLARNALSVQGAAWSADSQSVLYLTTDESGDLRLGAAPLDGAPAELIPRFSDPDQTHVYSSACAVTRDRFLYTVFDGVTWVLGEFAFQTALGAGRYSVAATPSHLAISDCTASANGTVLVDGIENRASGWTLPIDAESGAVSGPSALLTALEPGYYHVQLTPDGSSALLFALSKPTYLLDCRTGAHQPLPDSEVLSSDGLFVLRVNKTPRGTTPVILAVLNPKTGQSWGGIQTAGVRWDLSAGGQWVLTAGMAAHRIIEAWETRTAEHRPVYAHPTANLYLANFSKDGRWALFISEEAGRQPRMWAAPFRGLQIIPPADWVDLGAGDYPRWSPAGGRIYFTQVHDGFECIFTRAVDPATKRPVGPVAEVLHFHDRLTPQGVWPGSFRISVARDKLAFILGEQTHRLLEWR
jgi:dipeptidyl aminopeptidase/acylaminoacyl peptidase